MKKITKYLNDLSISIEGTEYEFKVDLNKQDPIKWIKTVVAFSNDLGGKICIGVTNEGYAKGFSVEEADKRPIYFNDMVRNKIFPKIDFTITPIETDEKNIILLVDIPVCKSDVVRYRENSQSAERIFRRYPGSTYELISIDEIAQYFLQKRKVSVDKTRTEYLAKDFAFNTLNEYFNDKTHSESGFTEKQLKSFGLITHDGYLTLAGLYFADEIPERFPAIFLRKWPGLNKGSDDIVDSKEFYGNLIDQLQVAEKLIRNNSHTGLRKTPNGDRNVWSYPAMAVTEALVNAIVHRDYLNVYMNQIDIDIYKDRIEIVSPGNFLPEGNAQDYADIRDIPSVRRNEAIADALTACGLMQRSGSGFDKIVEAYSAYGSEYQPQVFSKYGMFWIILKDVTYIDSEDIINIHIDLPKNQKIVYETILNNPGLRIPELSQICGLSETSVNNAIRKIRPRNLVTFKGSSRVGGYEVVKSTD